jgi:tetratricopeptide (TPR) repeat protein
LANNLISLAALYVDTGSYEKAEPLYSQSLEILKNTLGPQHSAVAYVLNNLGHLNSKLGDYDKAEAQYQRAISIWENSLGPEHPNVAIAMDNLAIVYELTEDYKLAEPLYTRALKIRETKLGSDHPDVSRTVNNLATLYAFEGDYAKAEQLFKRVLQTKQKTIGIQSISYTNSLINLAWVYQNKNDYVQAKQLYEKAIGIWKDLLGPEHPNVSTGYGHLSDLYLDTGDFENAYPYLYRTLDLDNKIIDQVMGFTSQHQKLKFMAENKWSLYKLLHIVDRHFRNDSSKRKEVFNVWLRRKGSILEAQKRYQETIFQFGDSQSAEIFKELSAIRMKLSKMTLSIPEEELQSYKKQKTGLQNQKEKLEAKLSRLSQDFETKQMISRADSEMVARILPVGTVLLEFARIESDNFKNDRITDRYICFVLHAEMQSR